MTDLDYYRLLGVPKDASQDEIRDAYFEIARRLHPDVNSDLLANEQFLILQQAYETLSKPERRSEYDAALSLTSSPPEISINIKYSREGIPRLSEPQLIYVLLELICTAEFQESKRPATSICVVIDRSNSMKGGRLEIVKENVIQLLKRLGPKDMISVVAFSDRAEVVIPPTGVNELTNLEQRIRLLSSGGGTEIFQGLRAGVNQLRLMQNGSAGRHLILLTDGHTYGDEKECVRLAKLAANEGIAISTLGIGHEWNDVFLDQLASLSGGNTIFVSAAHHLAKLLEEKIMAIDKAYARGIRFEFKLNPQTELRYAFRLYPEAGPLAVSSPMILGNLPYARTMVVVLEFLVKEVPEGTENLILAEGRLRFELPEGTAPVRLPLVFERATSGRMSQDQPPPALVEALARLTLYRLHERARQEVEEGDILQATKHLQYLATNLLSYGDRELAHTVLVEAEHIKQSRRFSKEGDKQIKYGTRALLLPPGLESLQP